MAVHRPWRDIPPVDIWSTACRRHTEVNRQVSLQPLMLGRSREDPRTLFAGKISRELAAYHALPKANLELFTSRAVKLRTLAKLAAEFINNFSWDQDHLKWQGERKRDADQHLARLALSIQNRGLAKAGYLETLLNFYSSRKKGSTNDTILQLLNEKQTKTINTIGLVEGVRLEQLDPFHRVIEGTYYGMDSWRKKHAFDSEEPFGMAFGEWVRDYNDDMQLTPHFYIWLENHPLCTGRQWTYEYSDETNFGEKHVRSVRYGSQNLTWCKVLLQGAPVYWMDTSLEGDKELADTLQPDVQTGTKYIRTYQLEGQEQTVLKGGAAYVWDMLGVIFVFSHLNIIGDGIDHQHHSSPKEGDVVQCAGNLVIRNGQIIYVDADSGHYRPDITHLKFFCRHLDSYYGLSPEAVVKPYGGSVKTWGELKGVSIGGHRG